MPSLTAAEVRRIVGEEIKSAIETTINPTLQKLEEDVKKIADLKRRVEEVERSAQFASDQLDHLYTSTLPRITSHIESIAIALSKRQLDLDVHRRKWSLTLSGLNGEANESEDQTRAKCVDLAKNFFECLAPMLMTSPRVIA